MESNNSDSELFNNFKKLLGLEITDPIKDTLREIEKEHITLDTQVISISETDKNSPRELLKLVLNDERFSALRKEFKIVTDDSVLKKIVNHDTFDPTDNISATLVKCEEYLQMLKEKYVKLKEDMFTIMCMPACNGRILMTDAKEGIKMISVAILVVLVVKLALEGCEKREITYDNCAQKTVVPSGNKEIRRHPYGGIDAYYFCEKCKTVTQHAGAFDTKTDVFKYWTCHGCLSNDNVF